ncbi:MAG TPA: efflux RND transporter periplasmic adaptor subunit [Thermoanaerobaculia bacterium]|nr:efflux RND transporter periplasmic adaptor subunit [Thermoanaerobaculia bacterium]HQR66468.1 efflux RND transporter periplasmic adaptor subunit [Thermoanaerobaculia bacterium]
MLKKPKTPLLLLLAGALLPACGGTGGADAKKGKGGRGLAVRTASVAARDVVYRVQALGSLEPEEFLQITAEVSGAVKEVLFNAGDDVTAETVLVRIDPDRYRLEAERAAASHRRAVADWKRAESDLARREALAKERLVADEELIRARQEAERLAADAASAQAASAIAQQNLERSSVRAPRRGKVNTRTVDPGQFVQTGNLLATLVDLHRLRLRFKVSEAESLKATVGQSVTFRVASLGSAAFTARVYHVGGTADPATRQVEILAWVDNPGVLKPGFFAEVTLSTGNQKGALVVAESAVQASERGFVVYAVEGGRATARPVKIGLRTGDGSVEILSGLAAGETIVTEGSDRLTEGMAVDAAGSEAPGTR